MPSTPKEQKTTTAPWKEAEPYVIEQYKLADKLFKDGAPKQWEGKNIADQSKATLDAMKGIENLARNGDTSALTNANKTVNSIMNQTANTPANKTLTDLQKGVDLGKNPTDKLVSNIANGKTANSPGKFDQNYTNKATEQASNFANFQNGAANDLKKLQNFNNPAIENAGKSANYTNAAGEQAQQLSNFTNGGIDRLNSLQNFSNPALANAQGMTGYQNSAISNIQQMLGQQNPALAQAAQAGNFQNSAVGQAAGYNQYTNAASGLQNAQANNLANGNNPAMDMLQKTASGAEVGANPYLDQMVSSQQDKIADKLKNVTNPGIDSQAAAMGRMGSGAFATQRNNAETAAATSMADVATQMYGNQYNTDKDRQMSAANQYGSLYNADQQNQMQANQALSQTSNAQQQNRMQGTQMYGDLQNSQQQMRNAGTQMYGDMYGQQQQQQLNAANSLGSLNDSQQNARLNANQQYGQLASDQNQQRLNSANALTDAYNQQNAQRLAGNQNWANINDSQQSQRLAGNQQYGQLSSDQNQQRLNATTAYGDLLNQQQNTRMQGAQLYGNLNDSQQTQRLNAANSMNDQFNQDRAYQMQGLNMMNQNYQNNIANMLASNDQRMNAANAQNSYQSNLNNQRLQAADMSGDMYNQQFMPYERLAGIGQQRDDRASLELQADINKWDRTQQQPIQNVQNFLNMLQGGGYQTQTTPVYSNTGAQVLGGLSSLAGLLALCSRTAKIVHSLVGHMPLTNGLELPIYSFSYIDDPEQKIWIGPIAEMLEEVHPEAVVEIDGRKHINVASFVARAA